jgi:AraC family transcriptional regulator of adaptative response/methylated-DNA-[protein]-cysteine methyltransferase
MAHNLFHPHTATPGVTAPRSRATRHLVATAPRIRFTVSPCSLGQVLVAASAKGICAVLLGADAQALVRDLEGDFPRDDIIAGDAEFERLSDAVVAAVEAPARRSDQPLDMRGTAFQHCVWQALCTIPPGTTTTYASLAERIGKPRAVRAVARACAANTIAVLVPCHRVVRSDGSLSGYRWGAERKQALLAREAAAHEQARTT